ncbi:MAG: VWA domain-containing protein [Rhizobiales bacterium]|nr:VWA domain-containing protein [Hyphomicrobiales bacterium]
MFWSRQLTDASKAVLALLALVYLNVIPISVQAAERTMIVLDGSGSMWGQINGKPKLVIARETLREVLKGVSDTTILGLMAYGHRVKGDCSDIELIVPPRAGSADEIANKVDSLKFLGKTPLSAAVQLAAKELRYTEDKATVILITDGLETCKANICEIGTSLEAQGLDFTAHVVGFGLSKAEGKQVACLAENTGGQYFSAANASELVEALNQTVAAIIPNVRLVAIDQNGNRVTGISLDWTISDANNQNIHTTTAFEASIGSLEAGDYSVSVAGQNVSGGTEFSIIADVQKQIIEVPVEVQQLEATLDAPASVARGATFDVVWGGPNAKSDYVTIVEIGAKPGVYTSYFYTQNGNPAAITAPDGVGTYEIRYVYGETKQTVARRDIEVTEIAVTIDVAKTVAAGAEFAINWFGPAYDRDYLTIVAKGSDEGEYLDYAYAQNGNPSTLSAPDGLGDYEIRYVLGSSKRTLASVDIKVTAVAGNIDAPATVFGSTEFLVNWSGPSNKGDYITIVPSGVEEGEYLDYAYTQNGNPAKITAPDAVGDYEIRYVFGSSKRTLAFAPIELLATSATLSVVNAPVPGGKITVEWTGPNGKRDYITIVEKGAEQGSFNSYAYTGRGSPVEFKVPKALGLFEVRYVVGVSKRTLTNVDVMLRPVNASISAPSKANAGDAIEVSWTGPNSKGDRIEITKLGAKDNANPLSKAGTIQGSPLFIYVPETAGKYEIRYKLMDTRKVIARSEILVE